MFDNDRFPRLPLGCFLVGPTGPTGATGPAGADASGFFSFTVDENGYLYMLSDDSATVPTFNYDSDTGALYVVQTTD